MFVNKCFLINSKKFSKGSLNPEELDKLFIILKKFGFKETPIFSKLMDCNIISDQGVFVPTVSRAYLTSIGIKELNIFKYFSFGTNCVVGES